MEKYTMPKLPSMQHILEDLFDEDIVDYNADVKQDKLPNDIVWGNASACYENLQQLLEDVSNQETLNAELDQLNQKLLAHIANMKKQASS